MAGPIKIIMDQRERNSELNRMLESGAEVEIKTLHVGDYIVSDRIAIERKTIHDFQSSILNGRIFEQTDRIRSYYNQPIIIIEGDRREFQLDKKVFIGAIVSLYIDHNSTVIFSENPSDTADTILSIAKHEQKNEKREVSLKGGARAHSTEDSQLSIVGNIPGVGPKLAKALLRHFKNIKNIAIADKEELMKVEKIGKKKAEAIRKVMDEEFKGQN